MTSWMPFGRVFTMSDKTKILIAIESHKSNIIENLGGNSLAGLTEIAIKKNLIEP
jgi:hypothetical protein